MPRINRIQISIETAANGWSGPVCVEFNGHQLPLDNVDGSVLANSQLVGECSPNSFAHSVILVGPDTGSWDIAGVSVMYDISGEDDYSVKFGAVTLDETQSLDLWEERPLLAFDV
ncbi:MAG TPA: helicase [Myxococcales bacterium]|nr:helicase [Myxococcales bacterium]HIN85632.1 helicase [Myxococcales bacterium]